MDPGQIVNFLVESNQLKKTKRYSPCKEDFHESTAGHSWHLSIMIPIIAREFNLKLDILHALEIAIVHDLPEYVLEKDFDSYLVASGKLNKLDKNKSEEDAMQGIQNKFEFGDKLYDLWKEFEDSKTPEARFVKALDKLESHMHVIQLGVQFGDPKQAEHQILYADEAVRNFPELKPLLKATKEKLRPLMEKDGLVWKEEYNYPN